MHSDYSWMCCCITFNGKIALDSAFEVKSDGSVRVMEV